MRPNPDRVLQGVAAALLVEIAPRVPTPYGQQTVGLAATLSMVLSQEIDRLADRLAAENRAMVGLFASAAPVVTGAGLRERLLAATAHLETPDIRVSTLQQANDALRALLIELHAAVEASEGEPARLLEERIWDELRESTRRRQLAFARR